MRLILLLPFLLFPLSAAAQDTPPVVELGGIVNGKPLADYANLWWQWAFSMTQDMSPVSDHSGVFCAVNQTGSVWYLAGVYGTDRVVRRCQLPGGKHIFFPVINMLAAYSPDQGVDCPTARAEAARNNDRFVFVRVILDGVPVPNAERFRIAPEDCFDPLAGLTPSKTAAPRAFAATDGYWIMLRPLPAGRHLLEFKAFYTNDAEEFGDMVQNIAYDLTVLPE